MSNEMKIITQINAAADWIKSKIGVNKPKIGIILGTGLGALVNETEELCSMDYEDIPHFPVSTVESHHGRLLLAKLNDRVVLIMQGRFHYYEGYSMQQITFPVRVMKKLGIETMLISNACGCVNPQFRKGEVMIMEDHINLLGDNPLIGQNLDEFGPRFPDMSAAYDPELINLAEKLALEYGIPLVKGVYTAIAGPNLETRAEYRFIRTIGSDVVGMSTVPECIVARHMDMRVFGVSIITDECFPEALKPVELEEILAVAAVAEPVMTRLISLMVANLS
jgi:purine-nucleoside phosphorylase